MDRIQKIKINQFYRQKFLFPESNVKISLLGPCGIAEGVFM